MQLINLLLIGRHHADLIEFVGLLAGHQQDLVFLAEAAAHHPEVDDHAPVGVVIGVKDQRLERLFCGVRRRRHPINDGLQDLRHAQARFG